MKVHNLLVTGSLTSGGENITAISSSVSSTVTSLSSSVSTSIGSLSSSMVVMITDMSSSLTSSIGSMSSSMSGRFDTIESTTGSLNSFTSSANNRFNSIEGITGSYATTGSNIFKGDQTISGSIIPAVDNTYDLGSLTHQFRDLYLSSASLYIDGTKVLSSTTQELQITTDAGQSIKILEAGSDTITLQSHDGNVTIAASGGGDVILDPTNGIIALKGTTTLYAGNRILSSDGNAIQIGNSVTMTGSLVVTGFIETQELRTTYISSSILFRSGSTKFGDELTDTHDFTGSLNISGSISVPGSNLVSGSSQITYSGLSSIPSGIISGSSQLPSGLVSGSSQITYGSISSIPSGIVSGSAQVISLLPGGTVSGSVQVDVMSTTNIARLATTGSNTFSGDQTINASNVGRINLGKTTETRTAGAIIAQSSPSYGPTGKLSFSVSTWGVNTDYDLTEVMAIDMRSADTKGATIYMNPFGGGRLGLGTVTPASIFHISGSTNDIGVRMTNSTASRTFMSYVDTSGNYIIHDATADSNRLTVGSTGAVGINSYTSTIPLEIKRFAGSGGTLRLVGNDTVVGMPSLSFLNDNGNGGASITMTTSNQLNLNGSIYANPSGFVGMGTDTPATKLDVNGDGRFVSNSSARVLYLKQNGSNTGNIIQFQNESGSDVWEVVGRNNQFYVFNTAQASMSIYVNPTTNNVGIGGTTSPTCSLDVGSRTDAVALPRGTTAQRPTSLVSGMGRFNTTTSRTEFYNGVVWVTVGGTGDGTTSSSPAPSAKAIKTALGNPTSGNYWLQIPNVNGGNPFLCYCDFTVDGGIGYAIIYNQYFEGSETGPSHANFGSSTITTAGFSTEYQISPSTMVTNYGLTKLLVFARSNNGTADGGIQSSVHFNWVAFSGPSAAQYNNIFTNGYGSTQFTGNFNSADGNTGTAHFPSGHPFNGGVTQISNGPNINFNTLYEYKQGTGTDPNHFWMVGNGRASDTYFIVDPRYGSSSSNVLFNRWGGVALH